jgi:hypothetical protein
MWGPGPDSILELNASTLIPPLSHRATVRGDDRALQCCVEA